MKVKCFGIAKDITSTDVINIENSNVPKTVSDLRSWVNQTYPGFNKIKNCMIAVNQEYADDDLEISLEDEIALIPPVSGG